jgi:DNA-binding transcriptional LysR family regulator
MYLDPRRLVVLRAVADTGGVLAAADRLHLTPSAVSQQLARLERETGLTLFDRSRLGGRRPLGLTAAGRLLADHAIRLGEVLAAAEQDLADLAGHVTGTVTVGAFPTAIRHLVSPAVAALATTHPMLRPAIRQVDEGPGVAALHAGTLDLLLVDQDADRPPPEVPGLQYRRVLDDRYEVAMPAAWPPPASLADLARRPWVDGPDWSAVHRVLDRLARALGAELRRDHVCLEFPAALALVEAGLCAAIVPKLALPDAPTPTVRLMALPEVGARRIGLLHRSARHEPTPASRILLDALVQRATDLASRDDRPT